MVPVSNPKECVPGTPEQGARETGKTATRSMPPVSEVKEAEVVEGAAKKCIYQQIGMNDKNKDGVVVGNGMRSN